jgi:class 3 adenylate cyclase/tetratricopeptide (TPR) repeat protein
VDSAERLRPYVAGLAVAWTDSMPEVRHRGIEGSLAFVDISGFTTLTERLAAKGKVGAEEMSDLLNASFATLLEVAYGYGASLVKWGGDAVLLLYEGPDHAAQACRAAYEMQRTMRRIGRLRTSVGVVQLRMSVGINSGTFDFFLVGERHRELLVAGPAATETATMEQIAEAGEVVVGPATVALVPQSCIGAAKEAGWLLRSGPAAAPRSRWWPPARTIDSIAGCLDATLREHLLTEVGESEHRQVAVGFVEVSGVDALLVRQGPGAAAGALHELTGVVQEACAHHRVTFWETDISKDGFKILLIGGAPRSSGHDEDAMLRAARAILDGYDGPVGLRIGLNTGRVFNGGFGPPFRRTWSVKGDAVNLAARVMGKAAEGQLLATEALLRRVGSRVEADLLPPFTVKGKKLPVHAALVRTVSAEHLAETATASALVGRRGLVDVLLGAAADAARGNGTGVVVTGDAGVGKSRLVDHICNRLDPSVPVLRGFAADYESATPYYPMQRPLRAALGLAPNDPDAVVADELRRRVVDDAPHLVELLPLVAVPFGVDLAETAASAAVQEEFRRARTHALVVELLTAVLSRPSVLVVDDVQDADDASCDLLAALCAATGSRPWLVVLVGRECPAALRRPVELREVVVPPLSSEEAEELVRDAPGGDLLRPHVVRLIVARADGNPLFLRELTTAAATAAEDDLPSTLEELLAAQLDRLSPADRRLLRTVSVLGSRFDETVAGALLEEPPTAEQWRRLDHFLAGHADGSRRFRTTLVRDTAYEGLPFRRRVELHGRAASALEDQAARDGEDRAEALSMHCLAAQRYADAWIHARRAGERARRKYANVEALVFLDRALAAARRLPELSPADVSEVHEVAGDVHGRLAELDRAAASYRDARRRAPGADRPRRARLALRIGLVMERAGSPADADRWMTRAHRELQPSTGGPTDVAAVALDGRIAVERAYAQHMSGRESAAARLARRAAALAGPVGADEVLGRALLLLDVIDLSSGRPSDPDRVKQAVALFERCGDLGRQASGWNYLGMTAYFRGDWAAAVEAYTRAAEAENRAGDDYSAAIASGNIGEILVDQGRLVDAEPLVAGALRLWRTTKTPHDIGWGAALLGRLEARRGRYAEAMALFSEALEAFAAKDERFEVVDTEMRIAEAFLLQGQPRAAQQQLRHAVSGLLSARQVAGLAGADASAGSDVPDDAAQAATLLRLRAVASFQLADDVAARADLAASSAAARRHGSDHELGLALQLQARMLGAAPSADADALLARLGIAWTPQYPERASAGAAFVELPRQRIGSDQSVSATRG